MKTKSANAPVPTGRLAYMNDVDEIAGNPACGFLYHKFVKLLTAAGRRVIIPDMIDFGLSEEPVREQVHTLNGHIVIPTGLLRQVEIRNATTVCHDWGRPNTADWVL